MAKSPPRMRPDPVARIRAQRELANAAQKGGTAVPSRQAIRPLVARAKSATAQPSRGGGQRRDSKGRFA